MQTIKLKTVGGEEIEVLPIGTAIQHRTLPQLTGKIVGHEYHESGAISPIPYRIQWDNEALAATRIGGMYWWAGNDSVEPRSAQDDIKTLFGE